MTSVRIRVYEHPLATKPARVVVVPSLAEWLMDSYPSRRPGAGFNLYAGEPSAATDISRDADAILRQAAPEYVVLETPGGADPITWAAILASAGKIAVAAVISYSLNSVFGKDPKPLENRSQESANNQLSNRENQVRLLQRVEDIYGTVRAVPSLLMPTYFKYIDQRKVEYAYLCIGRGYYDISDVCEGDTPLSEIGGASAAVYPPFTSPNSGATPQLQIGDPIIDSIVSVSRSGSIDAIVLKPQNQLQLTAGRTYLMRGPSSTGGAGLPATGLDLLFQPSESRKPNVAAVAEASQTLSISMADTPQTRELTGVGGTHVDVDGPSKTYTCSITGFFRGVVDGSTMNVTSGAFANPADNTGLKTVVSHTAESVTVAETVVTESGVGAASFDLAINYSGPRTISAVESGYVTLTGAPQFFEGAAGEVFTADITVANGLTDWTDWFTLPQTDRTEVWTNVVALNGMFKDDGAKQGATVAYEVQIEQLDSLGAPTGVVETVSGSLSGATSTERAETLEQVTGWTGPARVRARRTTAFDYDFTGAVVDEIQWMDLYGVAPVTKADFGNKTTIHTVTQTTMGSTAVSRRELNCLASRLLPVTFDGSTFSAILNPDGSLATGTLHPTNRIVDIIAAVTVDPKIGARAITDIDLAQIWAVQQELDLWNIEAGQFNYTFDNDNFSYEETVRAIADAAFCAGFRQNGRIRLALDRPQSVSAALFNHRNKASNAETITRRFASDADYDGVELIYMDPDTEKQETIRLPLDGSATKLKRVEVSGIRSFPQAWLRANREYGRLRSQRVFIETDTTTDARMLLPNVRVDIVDNTRFTTYDGDVVGQSGLTLTLSRNVLFTPAQPHSIVLAKRDGSTQAIACTAGSAANQVVLAAPPAEALITERTAEDGERTRFWFAADTVRGASAWLVQEITFTDTGYVRIRAANYSDAYYAADDDPVPDKAIVIN